MQCNSHCYLEKYEGTGILIYNSVPAVPAQETVCSTAIDDKIEENETDKCTHE